MKDRLRDVHSGRRNALRHVDERTVRVAKKAVCALAIVALLANQTAVAQALLAPLENFAINRAEAAILTRVAISRGFAANDPRIASTLSAMSNVSTSLNVASTATAAALTFAGAPVWLTIAAGLGAIGIGSVIAGALSGGSSSPGSVSVVSDATGRAALQINTSTQSDSTTSPGASGPQNLFPAAGNQPHLYADSSCMPSDACAAFPPKPASLPMYWKVQSTINNGGHDVIDVGYYSMEEMAANVPLYNGLKSGQSASRSLNGLTYPLTDSVSWTVKPYWETAPNGSKRLHGIYTFNTTCTPPFEGFDCSSLVPAYATDGPQTVDWYSNTMPFPSGLTIDQSLLPVPPGPPSTIYAAMPSSLAQAKLDSATLANLTNATWQAASSQPGYQGLPYSVTQPVTADDVTPWAVGNPQSVPDISDLFRPASDPGASVVISPVVQPVTTGSPNPGGDPAGSPGNNVNVVNTPNVSVVNKVSVDLGADPGVTSPTLESTPTISMILSPVVNLLPDLKHWAVPAHSSACPEPSFSVMGHSFTLTAQCDLAESNRAGIYTAFAAMFTLAALFVVLRA